MKLLDFLNIIAFITLFTGVVTLVNRLLQRIYAIEKGKQNNVFLEYCESFFPVLLLVLIIRSFIFQPFNVPSESLEPSVMPGDLIFVTQYDYGLKIPFWNYTIIPTSHPQTGQIALFHSPVNPTQFTLVKRVIGLPGDHISYINKIIYINGKKMSQTFTNDTQEIFANGETRTVKEFVEDLNGVKHKIIVNPETPTQNFVDVVVPKGHYFMMGDNRDDSDDSRSWGFVPVENFIGHAHFTWFSLRLSPFHIDWHRIGQTFRVN